MKHVIQNAHQIRQEHLKIRAQMATAEDKEKVAKAIQCIQRIEDMKQMYRRLQ